MEGQDEFCKVLYILSRNIWGRLARVILEENPYAFKPGQYMRRMRAVHWLVHESGIDNGERIVREVDRMVYKRSPSYKARMGR